MSAISIRPIIKKIYTKCQYLKESACNVDKNKNLLNSSYKDLSDAFESGQGTKRVEEASIKEGNQRCWNH